MSQSRHLAGAFDHIVAFNAAWAAAEDRRREQLVAAARELSERPIHGADGSHLIRGEN